MKKLFKVIAVLIALFIVLLVVGSIALRIYLPPEKAKALVLERLSAQLKREVELGAVSVGLFSGLQMTNLKISESPAFSKGTFLSSDQFSLKIALIPILFRKMVVRQIVLKRPEVSIIRYADGKTFNFSNLTSSTATTPSPTRGEDKNLPFLLLISDAEIQKGAIHFVDRSTAKQSMDIAPVDLKLRNVSLTSPFSMQAALHVKSKGMDLALNLAGQANLLEGTFALKQGSLTARDSKIVLSGDISRLKTAEPAVDLKIDIPQLHVADFGAFVSLPPGVAIDQPLKGTLSLRGDQKSMELQSQMSLGSLRLDSHGKVQNVAAPLPEFSFHTETNAFPVEEVLHYAPAAVPPAVVLKGTMHLSADLSGTRAAIQFAAKCVGTDLSIAQGDKFAKPAGMPLELSIIGTIASLEPVKVFVRTMTLQLAANSLAGSGSYEARGAQGVINAAAKAVNWSVADLAKMSPLLAPYHPTGTLSFDLRAAGPVSAPQTSLQTAGEVACAGVKQEYYEGQNLQLKWNLTDVTPDLSKVSGTAALKQGPGKILNVEKLAAGSRIGKIVLMPLEILEKIQKIGVLEAALREVKIPSLQAVAFDSITGDYVLRSGIMEIKTFDLSGRDLSIQNRGTVGLAGVQPINLSVVMKMAPGAVGGTLGQIMNDENGRPTLKFAATGSAADPKVKLDVQEAGKKALQQAGQEILKNKDVQNAVNDLQKSFKGLFH